MPPPATTPTAVLVAVALSVVAVALSAAALLVTLSRGTGELPTANLGAAGATFTPLPTLAAEATATSGDGADATVSPSPVHAAPGLEALLPRAVNGVPLVSQSTRGDAAGLDGDASGQALISALQSSGKTAADLEIAEAYDASDTYDITVTAFQATGMDAATLRQAIVGAWMSAAGSGVTSTQGTVGGKAVTTIEYGGGPSDYIYVHGAVVFDVSTSDADLAAQALMSLP